MTSDKLFRKNHQKPNNIAVWYCNYFYFWVIQKEAYFMRVGGQSAPLPAPQFRVHRSNLIMEDFTSICWSKNQKNVHLEMRFPRQSRRKFFTQNIFSFTINLVKGFWSARNFCFTKFPNSKALYTMKEMKRCNQIEWKQSFFQDGRLFCKENKFHYLPCANVINFVFIWGFIFVIFLWYEVNSK